MYHFKINSKDSKNSSEIIMTKMLLSDNFKRKKGNLSLKELLTLLLPLIRLSSFRKTKSFTTGSIVIKEKPKGTKELQVKHQTEKEEVI